MKTLVYALALLCVAVAMPQAPKTGQAPPSQTARQAAPPTPPVPNPSQKLGAGFYGPGVNNPRAVPLSPRAIAVAQSVLTGNPSIRARLLVNGELQFTDEFGQEVEVLSAGGVDVNELINPEDAFEIEQERREQEFKLKFQLEERRAEIARQRANLDRLSQQLGLGASTGGAKAATGANAQQFHIRA